MTRARLVVPVLLALLTLSGCSGSGGERPSTTQDGATGATVTSPPPRAPRVGACYRLDVRSALRATSSRAAVPCAGRHTAVTVAVGNVQPVVDGHLLALGSTSIQRQIADRCRRAVDAHVGGSVQQQRLSRVQAVWFNPTAAQVDSGALWYRCDLVISGGTRTFANLPRKTSRLLQASGALHRWGTCGTTAPSSKRFQRVLCSARHTWRARSTVTLPTRTTYLSRSAAQRADARCKKVAASLSPKSTKLRWAFEWPTRAQWYAGQRYGFCWTPDTR